MNKPIFQNRDPDSKSHAASESRSFSLKSTLAFISRRHQSDGLLGGHPQLRANLRGAQSPQRYTAKSSLEEELKKLITLDSPPPCEEKVPDWR